MASTTATGSSPSFIVSLLRAPWAYHAGAIILTYMYWLSGFTKLFNFSETLGEMSHFGLNPPAVFAVATIIVQLGGSALVILGNRWAWLGAGALIVFTLATIPLAHRFWEMDGPMAMLEMLMVQEHITVVGGLILAAVLAEVRRTR